VSDTTAAAERVRAGLELAAAPDIAIVLGSGLGGLEQRIESPRTVSYGDIPGVPQPQVAGHAGRVVSGQIRGRHVLAFSGRVHLYEGHDAALAGVFVRLAHALGARTLLLSNAAGGVRPSLRPGDLMLIVDHVNLSGRNPLVGPVVAGESRFPDMSQPYDAALQTQLRAAAARTGVTLHEGTYGMLLGPTYETPAEVRMLARLGVDAVGMSTVPEVIVARALDMRCAALSCVTNQAAGISADRIQHADVLAVTARAAHDFERLVIDFVRTLDA
jgi:purine-nucleoside phosphorylase